MLFNSNRYTNQETEAQGISSITSEGIESQFTERGIILESTTTGNSKTITCGFDTYNEIIRIEKTTSTIAASHGEIFKARDQYLELTAIGALLFLASSIDTERILNELENHVLSPIFNAFKEACDETQIKNKLANKKPHEKWTHKEALCLTDLATRIKEKTKKGEFRVALNNHRRSSNKNTRESIKYIRSLLSNHSRILALRIDLGYQRSIRAKHKNSKILEIAKTQRSEMFKHLKSHFKSSLLGYIWKLEYGLEKGYHYHVMLFLDGSQKRQDVTIAKIIGEHWNNKITKGEGNYFNCNAQKETYGKYLGIGMISHADHEKIRNLEKAATYLSKADYYASLITKGGRTFGKGNMPSERYKPLGRPRKSS